MKRDAALAVRPQPTRCSPWIAPAFGAFTGNAEVLPRRGDQVFVIAEQEVLQVA